MYALVDTRISGICRKNGNISAPYPRVKGASVERDKSTVFIENDNNNKIIIVKMYMCVSARHGKSAKMAFAFRLAFRKPI